MTDPESRLALVSRAKAAKAARGQLTELTPAELDALGLPPVDCRRTRDRLGTLKKGAKRR